MYVTVSENRCVGEREKKGHSLWEEENFSIHELLSGVKGRKERRYTLVYWPKKDYHKIDLNMDVEVGGEKFSLLVNGRGRDRV